MHFLRGNQAGELIIKWRKLNNVLHRDVGYLCIGMTIIYALSGIAINHRQDWNPNYLITRTQVQWQDMPAGNLSQEQVLEFLDRHGDRDGYKTHYYPAPGHLKIFVQGGSYDLDRATGTGLMETVRRRPVFFQVNFLHYNPKGLWTWFSDLFCVSLMLLAITGMFVLKGRNGIAGRGWWLTTIGVVIPLVFLFFYL